MRQHRHRLGVQHQQARRTHNHLWRWTLAVNAMLVAVCAVQARSAPTHVLRATVYCALHAFAIQPNLQDEVATFLDAQEPICRY